MQNIFVTGATGFLGWNIVKELLQAKDNKIYLLVRSKNGKRPIKRIKSLLKESNNHKIYSKLKERIEVIAGDIIENNLGIDDSKTNGLIKKINTIYHCAALCEFGIPLEPIRMINVRGTKNILDFALKCKQSGHLNIVNHISTVAVVGKYGGVFYEDFLDIGQDFNNTYELTKFEAEKLIKTYRQKGLSISIFRPSIITGDSKTGHVSNFQMLYQPLHIFSLEIFSEIPANKTMRYNLVPVDYVAKAIYLASSLQDNNKNYHLVNTNTTTLDYFLDVASNYFGFKKPKVVSEKEFDFNSLKGFRKKVLAPYLPYFTHKNVVFDTTNFQEAVDGTNFTWPVVDEKLLLNLFKFCNKVGFIKRK